MMRLTHWVEGNFYKPENGLRQIDIVHVAEEHWVEIATHYQELAHTKKQKAHIASRTMTTPAKLPFDASHTTFGKYANSIR